MKKPLTFLLCVLVLNAFSQPVIEWQHCYGGSNRDIAQSVKKTADGGYIIAGYAESLDGDLTGLYIGISDYWLLKLDDAGNSQWQKAYGGTSFEFGRCVQQTSDGGYILAGSSWSNDVDVSNNHGKSDYWIVKVDVTGAIQWERSFGGSEDEHAWAVQQTTDGGYIVAGSSASVNGDVPGNIGGPDYWVLKLDVDGQIEWTQVLGGTRGDFARSVLQTSDGGYIVSGYSSSNDTYVSANLGKLDYWVIKLDVAGEVQWEKSYGGSQDDMAYAIQQTSDGGYIIAGSSESEDGDVTAENVVFFEAYWIVKINATGDIMWQRSFGGLIRNIAHDIQQVTGGEYIVAGVYYAETDDPFCEYDEGNFWIVKLMENGATKWELCLGSDKRDVPFSVQQSNDGGYVVAGYAKFSGGSVSCSNIWDTEQLWVIKLSADITDVKETPEPGGAYLVIFPNPASNRIQITFNHYAIVVQAVLTDMSGKLLYTKAIDPAGYLDVSDLPGGVYMLTVTDSNGIQYSEKILKL